MSKTNTLPVKPAQPALTPMQLSFLNLINNSLDPLRPGYLAVMYYDSIGKRRPVASRDSFGQTSAAYRTCRKLVSLNLVKEVQDYGCTSYAKI